MFTPTCHPESPFVRSRRRDTPPAKLRPASHSYLRPPREPLVAATIASLSGALVYAGVWLIRLLG